MATCDPDETSFSCIDNCYFYEETSNQDNVSMMNSTNSKLLLWKPVHYLISCPSSKFKLLRPTKSEPSGRPVPRLYFSHSIHFTKASCFITVSTRLQSLTRTHPHPRLPPWSKPRLKLCPHTVKAVLRGRFIALQAYLKKQEKGQINNLTLHLKQLGKEEMKNPRVSRRKEILKIRAEINAKETKEAIAKINKAKSWFF